MDEAEFKDRTKQIALKVIDLVDALPADRASDVMARQLLRSATSIGANYRAACRARSTADMINKLKIVEEEADETLYWLELLSASRKPGDIGMPAVAKETNEVLAMTVASIRTLRAKQSSSPIENRKSSVVNRKS